MTLDLLHLTPYVSVHLALLRNAPFVLIQTPQPDCFAFGELAGATPEGCAVVSGLKVEHGDSIAEELGPLCKVADGALGFLATHVLLLDGDIEAVVIDPETDEAMIAEEMDHGWDGPQRWEHLDGQGYVLRGGDGRLASAIALVDLRLAERWAAVIAQAAPAPAPSAEGPQ